MAGPLGVFGRRRREDNWKNFKQIEVNNKTECLVKDGEKCGQNITGKNTTNLKGHLKALHKEIEVS